MSWQVETSRARRRRAFWSNVRFTTAALGVAAVLGLCGAVLSLLPTVLAVVVGIAVARGLGIL